MIGTTLGHYKIVEKIGRGGMGEVYRALDTKLDRDVALKILPPDKSEDLERIQRFEREAKAVASLNHPNIVTIHSVEHVEGQRFLTMELIKGKTISELIPAEGFSLERIFDIAIPLSDALSAAHAKGVAHRDLKPSNIMVDEAGRLKVLDFGLAKLLAVPDNAEDATMVAEENMTGEGKIVGTVAYMSPEQANSKPLDHRSDIFSLGVVLYEMATGDRPFKGDTPLSTLSAILKDTPLPVSERRAALPRHLGRVIGRCLEKQPDKRFQTARDVCNELEGLQKEVESGDIEQIVSATLSRDDLMAARGAGGRKVPWAWLGAVGALAIVALYFGFFRGGSPEQERELSATPMTSAVGVESAGSWSPDGSFFAYSHSADGPADIFIVSSTGGSAMNLVKSPYDDLSPRWSPDNRWIAFISNRGQLAGIYLVPPLGGEPQLVASTNTPPLSGLYYGALGALPWSPDGKSLLFSRLENDERGIVWKIDLETRTETRVTSPEAGEFDLAASYSFDGERILVCRTNGVQSRLIVMSASGEDARELHTEREPYLQAVWAPDDRSILMTPEAGGLRLVDVASGAITRVTTGTEEHAPVVAKDGRVLYSTASHQTDLYVQEVESGETTRLTRHTLDNFGPEFSPDGSSIVYESNRTGGDEVWLLDLETGTERQLTQRESEDSGPSWSPGGREIVFAARHEGALSFWTVSATGGAGRLIGNYPDASSWSLRISPDDELFGFVSTRDGASAFHVIDRSGGESRAVLEGVGSFVWYADSHHIIYTPSEADRADEIRAVNLDTGEDALLLTAPHRELALSGDGSLLSYVSSLSHFNMNLHVLPLEPPADPAGLPTAAGPPRKITHGDGEWHVHNGSISHDGSRVVYTRDTDAGDIYLLEGVF